MIGAFLSGLYGIVVPPPPQDLGRLAGAGGDPNETAAAMVAGLALATALRGRGAGKPLVRMACGVAVAVCTLALFLTLLARRADRPGGRADRAVFAGRPAARHVLFAALGAVLVTVFYFATIAPAACASA